MALTTDSSGTQTATIGTEHSLAASTTAGTFVLAVDISNLAADEVLELRLKIKVLTGGTIRVTEMNSIRGPAAADGMIYRSVPVSGIWGCTATLKQLNGTGRSFDWSLLRY